MKRILTITAIVTALCLSYALAADMAFTITISIPSDNVLAVRDAYLIAKPIPQEAQDPNDPNSPMIDIMSAKNWILDNARQAAIDHIRVNYNRGRDQIDKAARLKNDAIVAPVND